MLLTASVALVARALGVEKAYSLLSERTPQEALLDFTRWAACPFREALDG